MTQHWRDLHRSELSPLVCWGFRATRSPEKQKAKPEQASCSKQLVKSVIFLFLLCSNITNGKKNQDVLLLLLLSDWKGGKNPLCWQQNLCLDFVTDFSSTPFPLSSSHLLPLRHLTFPVILDCVHYLCSSCPHLVSCLHLSHQSPACTPAPY